MKHSPTPWQVPNHFKCDVVDATNQQVLVALEMINGTTSEANAARIVHCVNNHDALVDALHEIRNDAIILSDEFLETFRTYKDGETLQGFQAGKWRKLAETAKMVDKLLQEQAK